MVNDPPYPKLLFRVVSCESVHGAFRAVEEDLGQRNSRFKNPASTVARRGEDVDSRLAFEGDFTLPHVRGCGTRARGAAWSNVKPGRGLGLKKQMLSDCDLRNLRRLDEGAGACRDRIAARECVDWNLKRRIPSSVVERGDWDILKLWNFEVESL